jgi:TonB family protein
MADEGMPRPLILALSISLACHLLGFGAQLAFGQRWVRPRMSADRLDVVYEYRPGGAAEAMQERLRHAAPEPSSAPSTSAPAPVIRIPERAMLGMGRGGPGAADGEEGEGLGGLLELGQGTSGRLRGAGGGGSGAAGDESGAMRSPVVDLTNLVEAAQGDPVLLSYFSVIRERIQQTANRQTWLAADQGAQGVVYLSFVLSRDGEIASASVLPDRSARSRPLQDIALTIIEASSPFPPFPPSIDEPAKTVVVPLEFMVGS